MNDKRPSAGKIIQSRLILMQIIYIEKSTLIKFDGVDFENYESLFAKLKFPLVKAKSFWLSTFLILIFAYENCLIDVLRS